MGFYDRRKILEMSRLAFSGPIGRGLVRRRPPAKYLFQTTMQFTKGINSRAFNDRRKMLEMSRFPRTAPIGSDLARVPPFEYMG